VSPQAEVVPPKTKVTELDTVVIRFAGIPATACS